MQANVLCGVDTSPAAEAVAGVAANLARHLDAVLTLVHVAPEEPLL